MKISGINNNLNINNEVGKRKVKDQKGNSPVKDKIEISEKAKILQDKSEKVKDMAVIKQRIEDKFYDSDEVLNKVATEILKDINK